MMVEQIDALRRSEGFRLSPLTIFFDISILPQLAVIRPVFGYRNFYGAYSPMRITRYVIFYRHSTHLLYHINDTPVCPESHS